MNHEGVVPEKPNEPSKSEQGIGQTVLAEWALWGKNANDSDYKVLRCSTGSFGRSDFYHIITRYASGRQESLPQYTVCWIPGENGHEGYLAVAIHELADPDPRRSGGRVQTARGSEIEYTRLFCVSYSEMARNQVRYTELVESVKGYQLPAGPTAPIRVELLETESPPSPVQVNALAEKVASLLLTTRPVCVLGAADTSAWDRLQFVEQVMSMLPYGLRATLSASTWASATARNLKFRLFFASTERADDDTTVYVTWGRQLVRFGGSAPEQMTQRYYADWLEHGGAEVVGELASQTKPVRFEPDEIREMIANLPRDRPVTDILEQIADGLRRGQLPVLRVAVRRLGQRRNRPHNQAEREKYRQEIKRLGLFDDYPKLPSIAVASAYRVLLDFAFGSTLAYVDYREIVSLVGGPLHGVLGKEVLNLRFDSYLPWLLTVKSVSESTDEELMAFLQQQGIQATGPITEFNRRAVAVRFEDRPVPYDFAVRYLRAYSTDPGADLRQRGYLADTLEAVFPNDRQAQRVRIKEMLTLVYGTMLDEKDAAELLRRPDIRHTAAFDEAVRELTTGRGTPRWRAARTLLGHIRQS